MSKLKRKDVEQKLTQLMGNVSSTAAHFGVTRQALYNFIERHDLQQVLDDARESMVDVAESALYRAAVQGEAWAVIWTLKTQGKRRGYVERMEQEVSGPNGGAIEIKATDYRAAIAPLAPRSVGDSDASGEG